MNPRTLTLRDGRTLDLPLFLPVYQPRSNLISIEALKLDFPTRAMIVNGFLLYKDAAVRARLENEIDLHTYIDFDGMIMTDSGAFQGLSRPLYLSNKKIVRFQDRIGADIVSPLDIISPPGDNRTTAAKKVEATLKRIREAKPLVERGVLAGVQQGGRFLELRRQSMHGLMEIGIEYLAIGSLVPFFNKNHNLSFVVQVIRDARAIAGESIPMHVYGAGDPLELPFLAWAGADIFDSSSYGHYTLAGWYMTPYGAVRDAEADRVDSWCCSCDFCEGRGDIKAVLEDQSRLAGHNLRLIFDAVAEIGVHQKAGTLDARLEEIAQTHQRWFPESELGPSWERITRE